MTRNTPSHTALLEVLEAAKQVDNHYVHPAWRNRHQYRDGEFTMDMEVLDHLRDTLERHGLAIPAADIEEPPVEDDDDE